MIAASSCRVSSNGATLYRAFSSCSIQNGRVGVSIVPPVHHKFKYKKAQVSERYRELLLPKSSIESSGFRPINVMQDRLGEYWRNTVASDMLLINYQHGAPAKKSGLKQREWDGSSPYHINRSLRSPRGILRPTKDVKRRDWTNVPNMTGISLNAFVTDAKTTPDTIIPASVQMQQITGVKPEVVYSKTNVPTWHLKKGIPIGVKVELKGLQMAQFFSTLTEIVLPRSKTFKGVSNASGDRNGNISFGVTKDEVRYFPEIEGNQELYPQTFGFDVTIHTSAQIDPEARTLLSAYGILFTGKENFPSRW